MALAALPKYCSWDVKELASDYGWTELPIHPNDEDRMLSFYSDQHGGVRANVYMKTGTVATSLEHPTKGKTQLYRGQRNTFEKLEEIFDNPRVHTESGYRTRAKLREEDEVVNDVISVVDTPIGCDMYGGLDEMETLRIEGDEASEYSDRDVMADLYSQGRLESVSEFDGESLMEKLMNKWDEEEEAESEEVELGALTDALNFINGGYYHQSVSEVDYSDITSTSEDNDDGGNDTDDGTTTGSDDSQIDSDQLHNIEESNENESEREESDNYDGGESEASDSESVHESSGESDHDSEDSNDSENDFDYSS